MDIKKISIALSCCLFTLFLHGQIQFNRVYNGTNYDRGEGIIQFTDSSYLVTGTSSSFADGPSQAFLMKLDKFGFVQWSKAYGGSESEMGRRVVHRPGVGYYLFGSSNSGASANFDLYVVHTDMSGAIIWEKRFDKGGWERIHDVLLLPDTSFIIAAETSNNVEQLADRYLLRMDKDGNIQWQTQVSGVGEEIFKAVTQVSDTTFWAVGSGYHVDSSRVKGYIALYHQDGTKLWDTLVGKQGEYLINEVHANGVNWIFTGQSTFNVANDFNPFYLKLNANFEYIFSDDNVNLTRSERLDQFVNYTHPPGQSFFVASQLIDLSFTYQGGEDVVLNIFAPLFVWGGYGINYGTTGEDGINEIINTNDGFACAVGFHEDNLTGGGNCFVVKIGQEFNFPSGTIPAPLSILNINEHVSTDIEVYPNPMQDKIIIAAHETTVTQVILYDAAGNTVLFSNQGAEIDVSLLPAGMYVLEVTTNRGKSHHKLIK